MRAGPQSPPAEAFTQTGLARADISAPTSLPLLVLLPVLPNAEVRSEGQSGACSPSGDFQAVVPEEVIYYAGGSLRGGVGFDQGADSLGLRGGR